MTASSAAVERAAISAGLRITPLAIRLQAGDGAESGTIVQTMQKGYRLGEQLIRPARVVVAE